MLKSLKKKDEPNLLEPTPEKTVKTSKVSTLNKAQTPSALTKASAKRSFKKNTEPSRLEPPMKKSVQTSLVSNPKKVHSKPVKTIAKKSIEKKIEPSVIEQAVAATVQTPSSYNTRAKKSLTFESTVVPEPVVTSNEYPTIEITPVKTVENNSSASELKRINYISPFVTTSRGKHNSRAERVKRNSLYRLELNQSIEEPLEIRQRKEAAIYFSNQVDTQTARLQNLINTWDTFKANTSAEFESEYVDLINVTNGQTRLLLSKKFNSFRELIDQCKSGSQHVLPPDLEGYWSMVYQQVDNCDARFIKLDKLKANNWHEVPDEIAFAVANITKRKPKKVVRSRNPREFMLQQLRHAHAEHLKLEAANAKESVQPDAGSSTPTIKNTTMYK